jgi:hypothetical protein
MIVIPVDGFENALKSLDYINFLFGSEHNLKVVIFYAMPGLPPIIIEESRKNSEAAKQLAGLEKSKGNAYSSRLSRRADIHQGGGRYPKPG